MFISRKALADILARVDRLEALVASDAGVDMEALKALKTPARRQGTACPGSAFGEHDFSGIIAAANGDGKRCYCENCGQVLGSA